MIYSRLYTRLVWCGLALFTFCFFWPPYAHGFVGDDYVQMGYIAPYVNAPNTVWQLFHPYELTWYYRPIQNLWLWGLRLAYGFNPFPYYYLQVCVHLVGMALLYRVARQFRLNQQASLVIVLLFGVHALFLDVVTWISGIAIVLAAVFTLLTVSCFLNWLHKGDWRWGGLTAVAFLLTLLTHEEGVLLLPTLIVIYGWHNHNTPNQTGLWSSIRVHKQFPFFFIRMGAITTFYIFFQINRPNITIQLSDSINSSWLTYLSLMQILDFTLETITRYLLLFYAIDVYETMAVGFGMCSLLGLFGFGLVRGKQFIWVGLAWIFLHLGFIYIALWSQEPTLFAGRHLYNAWLGAVLIIGAGLNTIQTWQPKAKWGLTAVCLLILSTQIYILNGRQQSWLAFVQRDAKAQQTLQASLPQLPETEESFIYVNRFPITTPFLPFVLMVWYEQDVLVPSSTISALRNRGFLNQHDYLFDYIDGSMVNLMPDVQQYAQTRLLWGNNIDLERVAENGRFITKTTDPQPQVSIVLFNNTYHPALGHIAPPETEEWLSLAYNISIEEASTLRFHLRNDVNLHYRIRLLNTDPLGFETIYTYSTQQDTVWTEEISLPLTEYAGQRTLLKLEVQGEQVADQLYWLNPRLTK